MRHPLIHTQAPESQHQQTVFHFYCFTSKVATQTLRQPVSINTARHYTLIYQQPAHTLRFSERIHSTLAFTYISVLRSQRFSFLHPLGEHYLTVCVSHSALLPPTENMPYSDVNPTARQWRTLLWANDIRPNGKSRSLIGSVKMRHASCTEGFQRF